MTDPASNQPGQGQGADPPDLAEGVPASRVADGGMLVGRVGEEGVLVARVGGQLFAVAAQCTHYHGPLGEGLLVGDTVRCPWHHACFSLRTGEAMRARLRPRCLLASRADR